MTKVRFHGPIAGFSGAMGEMVFTDNKEKGRTVAYMKTHYPPSEAQIHQQARFGEAAVYAKSALADPTSRQFYETIAKQRDVPPFTLALADYLNKPFIKPLDLSKYKGKVGDPISIRIIDDIGAADVDVTLSSIQGSKIETGKAVETGSGSGNWVYTATVAIPLGSDIFIEVIAIDHANNRTQMTENPVVGADE